MGVHGLDSYTDRLPAAFHRRLHRGPLHSLALPSLVRSAGSHGADYPYATPRVTESFDHPDFIFEPKLDGFRVLAHVRGHRCELVSRNGHVFKRPQLCDEIAHAVRAHSAVLDGVICCLKPDGRTQFNKLLSRREWPFFYAFDVLSIEGDDLTQLRLLDRKRRLLEIKNGVLPCPTTSAVVACRGACLKVSVLAPVIAKQHPTTDKVAEQDRRDAAGQGE
jgi:hypothetical protein